MYMDNRCLIESSYNIESLDGAASGDDIAAVTSYLAEVKYDILYIRKL